jgi:transcriptional regulator with XRE-family HTH domain
MLTQEIKDILANNLKHFRIQRQFSQAQLAEKANISVTFLSNIERGKMFPKVETLSRLTESLDVEVYELFRPNFVSKDNKKMMNRLSGDITKSVNSALADVFKHYMD